jgi:hypothetical protein
MHFENAGSVCVLGQQTLKSDEIDQGIRSREMMFVVGVLKCSFILK